MKLPFALLGAAMLGACSTPYPPRDLSVQSRIDDALKAGGAPRAEAGAALPPAVSQSLLPPLRQTLPRASQRATEPRFDLVVTDAPIAQVLHAIAADTRYSILLSPKLAVPAANVAGQPDAAGQGTTAASAAAAASARDLLTVNLKNVTVFDALDALRDTYGYEYTVEGTRIHVEPPELKTRFYVVNYTLGQRRGVSDLQVVAGTSGGGGNSSGTGSGGTSSGGSSGSSGSSGGYGSTQASALSTMSKSDIWSELEDSLRTILGCHIPRLMPPARGAGQTGGSSGTASGGSGTSGGGASMRADVSFVGDVAVGERLRGVDGCADGRAVTVNQMSGTVLVRGMPRELRTVERLMRTMQMNVERQVIIEAKVIDVQLNKDAQQGINWTGFYNGLHRMSVGATTTAIGAPGTLRGSSSTTTSNLGNSGGATTSSTSVTTTTPATSLPGAIAANTSLGELLGGQMLGTTVPTAFGAGLGIALQASQFGALLNFMETQGEVRVLSSPRIATLSNQKAVLKVGSEESFVTSISAGTSSISTGTSLVVAPTLNYQPFFSGIALDVTPQIDERDRVTLHVHAMVNSITQKDKLSSPQAGAVSVPFAVNSISETDSVVKTADGMMVVIGGLMMESTEDNRARVPGLGEVPVAGTLFRKGAQASTKRELVILIKPTVVKMDSDWSEGIAASQRRIGALNESGLSQRTE